MRDAVVFSGGNRCWLRRHGKGRQQCNENVITELEITSSGNEKQPVGAWWRNCHSAFMFYQMIWAGVTENSSNSVE